MCQPDPYLLNEAEIIFNAFFLLCIHTTQNYLHWHQLLMDEQNAMNNACEEWNQMDLFFMITTNKPTHQAED